MSLLLAVYLWGMVAYAVIIVAAGILDATVSPAVVIASLLLAPVWPILLVFIIYKERNKRNA